MYQKYKGLTSFELMGVCMVLIILSGAAIMNMRISLESGRITEAHVNIDMLGTAHTAYFYKNSTFASNATLVSEEYIAPGKMWDGTQMLDPWDNPLDIAPSGSTLLIQLSPASQARAGKNITFTVQ